MVHPVTARRYVETTVKQPVKMRQTAEAAIQRDVQDTPCRGQELFPGIVQPDRIHELDGRLAGVKKRLL